MNAGFPRGGVTGSVVRQHERQRAVALAVGAAIVDPRVAHLTAAMGVDLREPNQTKGRKVLSSLGHGLGRDGEVAAVGDGVGDSHGSGDAMDCAGAVAVADAVEVCDAFVVRGRGCEDVQEALPHRVRNRQHLRVPYSSRC